MTARNVYLYNVLEIAAGEAGNSVRLVPCAQLHLILSNFLAEISWRELWDNRCWLLFHLLI